MHSLPSSVPGVLVCILPELRVASSGKPSSPPTFEEVLRGPPGFRSTLSSLQPAPTAESQAAAICLLSRKLPEGSFIFAFLVLGVVPGTESASVSV